MADYDGILTGIYKVIFPAVVEHLAKDKRPPCIVPDGVVLWLLAEPSLEADKDIVAAAVVKPLDVAPHE